MRTTFLFAVLFTTKLNLAVAEIKNGYANEITVARESLVQKNALLHECTGLSRAEIRRLKNEAKIAQAIIAHYELTEYLLKQFKGIVPELYHEINTITDKQGRSVDVHIKFVPRDGTKLKSYGTTKIGWDQNDPDSNISEYGEQTVSVEIWTVNRALLVLSHELGHVKYQVPNLATYAQYHQKHYLPPIDEYRIIGHRFDDPSGKMADQYEKRYCKNLTGFMKKTQDRIPSPLIVLRTFNNSLTRQNNLAANRLVPTSIEKF